VIHITEVPLHFDIYYLLGHCGLFLANGPTTLQTDACLFASGHLKPVANTSMHSDLQIIFSCPLPSRDYILHVIGRTVADANLEEGMDRFACVRSLFCE